MSLAAGGFGPGLRACLVAPLALSTLEVQGRRTASGSRQAQPTLRATQNEKRELETAIVVEGRQTSDKRISPSESASGAAMGWCSPASLVWARGGKVAWGLGSAAWQRCRFSCLHP